MQLRDSKPFTPSLMLVEAELLQVASEFVAYYTFFLSTLLNVYDRFLFVPDAAQCGICDANGIFNSCDNSVGPVLYIRVQFNDPGNY